MRGGKKVFVIVPPSLHTVSGSPLIFSIFRAFCAKKLWTLRRRARKRELRAIERATQRGLIQGRREGYREIVQRCSLDIKRLTDLREKSRNDTLRTAVLLTERFLGERLSHDISWFSEQLSKLERRCPPESAVTLVLPLGYQKNAEALRSSHPWIHEVLCEESLAPHTALLRLPHGTIEIHPLSRLRGILKELHLEITK